MTLLLVFIAGLALGIGLTFLTLRTRITDLKRSHERELDNLTTQFKSMAGEALESNSRQLDDRSRRSLESVLAPMRDSLDRFTDDFRRLYLDDTNRQSVLSQSIETLRQLNLRVSDETRRLTAALKGNNAAQGKWGEMVLANILENSGLEPGRWLVYQEESRVGEQRMRPDAVIHCPRGRDIIIDAKVSLTAYLRSLDENLDVEDRKAQLTEHVKSIENHIRTLANKRYNENIGKHDAGFVLMFMPHEGAYLAALNTDPDLWQHASERGVIIASPTHLVTVVKLIEQMWHTEDQTANSLAIAEEASKMLDQFNDFLADLKNIKTSLDKADASWQSALKRLATGNGNLVRRAGTLRTLGIKTKRAMTELPDIEESENLTTDDKKDGQTFGQLE